MTDIQVNNILKDYLNGMSFKRLEYIYKIPSTTIYREFKKRNLLTKNRRINRYKEYNIEPYITFKRLYVEDKISISKIAKICNCSICKVQKYLKKYNITRTNQESKEIRSQNNMINSDWFCEINNAEKAYWLGFLMADGSISKDNYTCRLILAQKDEKHLSRFGDIFGLTVKNGERHDSRTKNIYHYSSIIISNKYLVSQLISLGMTNNKTYRLNLDVFENVPDIFKRDFIRGYFDGDGTARGNKIEFVSCSEKFLRLLGDYIVNELCIDKYSLYKRNNVTRITWYRNNNLKKFYKWMYEDSDLYLKRKEQDVKKFLFPNKLRWSKEEIDLLNKINSEQIKDKKYIQENFPNRTYNSVYRKYKRLFTI